ncbi:putative histone-lysine N-methyltransferase ATXR3 [Hordeum vulgare]|nr:putative histone-lysine N-methyltransferase ATXR3 [Hordeum vulgare]
MAGPRGRDGPLCGRRRRHPRADGGGGGDGGRPGCRVPSGSGGSTMELVVHGAGDGARSGGVNWCPTPPRSLKRDASPREEVLHVPASFQPAPAYQGPLAHLWTPSAYVDLVSDGDDNDTGGQ